MIYILSWTTKNDQKTLSRSLHSKLKKITGLFKEKWNSRTFQELPLKFKDFSRLCKPCYNNYIALFPLSIQQKMQQRGLSRPSPLQG